MSPFKGSEILAAARGKLTMQKWPPLAAIIASSLIAGACQPIETPRTLLNHPAKQAGLVPTGNLKRIRSIMVREGDETTHDVRDHLTSSTCFVPGDASADAVLDVGMYLSPSPENPASVLDMIVTYKGKLVARSGKVLWRGSESTRQQMMLGPGVHAPGMSFHRDVLPLDAELLLLRDLRVAGCSNGPAIAARN